MTDAGMAKIKEAMKNGKWDNAYSSRKTEEMPPDLERALQEDRDAWSNFQNFANSYRNNYISWINGTKSEVTRKRRINVVVERASLNKKPGIP